EIATRELPRLSVQTKGGTVTRPEPRRVPPVRLCPRCDWGTFRCGLDSENSVKDRSSFASGWLLMYSSTSREKLSSGIYAFKVSSSVGGCRISLAAWKAGIAPTTKPVVVKNQV